jgi:hypothetical protein
MLVYFSCVGDFFMRHLVKMLFEPQKLGITLTKRGAGSENETLWRVSASFYKYLFAKTC